MSGKLTIAACAATCLAAPMVLWPASAVAKPPADVPGAEAYQTFVAVTVPSSLNGYDAFADPPVPADRRLIVEFVTARVLVPTGQKPLLEVKGVVSLGMTVGFTIPLTFAQTTVGWDEYHAAQAVRIYWDGDGQTGPIVGCHRSGTGQAAHCSVSIAGYLIGR